jgi:hypothetical protein
MNSLPFTMYLSTMVSKTVTSLSCLPLSPIYPGKYTGRQRDMFPGLLKVMKSARGLSGVGVSKLPFNFVDSIKVVRLTGQTLSTLKERRRSENIRKN